MSPIAAPGWDPKEYNVVLDQHTHSQYSDGRLTLEQSIEWHISMGYNAICLSDHNNVRNFAEVAQLRQNYTGKIILLNAMEWTTNRIHMNMIGLQNWTEPIPSNPTDDEIKHAIQLAHEQGAVVTVNHILWSTREAMMQNHPTREQLLNWSIDFIEIVNDDSNIENVYDNESISFCEKNGIGQITGTDMHTPNELQSGAVHGWTFLNTTALTVDAVMAEIRAHRTQIAYSSVGVKDRGTYDLNSLYLVTMPLSEVGSLFRKLWGNGLDWVGVSMYLAYFGMLFIFIELYRIIKPKFWAKIRKSAI
jgi:predicted metal-dependent phosphoesterase TrpH